MLTTLLARNVTASTTDIVTNILMFEQIDGTWRDISADLMTGTTRRGKTKELDAFTAGNMTLTLSNNNRQYDPNYASSPYNGSILPQRRMQLLTIVNGTLYSVFLGYINSWTQKYTGPHSANVEVSLTDAFKVIAKAGMPTSVYAKEVKADSPLHWWRLGEAAGSTIARDTAGSAHLDQVSNTPTFGATGLPSQDTDSGIEISSMGDGVASTPAGSLYVTTAPLTLEAIVTPKSFAGTYGAITTSGGNVLLHFNNQGVGARLAVTTSAHALLSIATSDFATGFSITGSTTLVLGQTYHIVGVWDATGAARLYVNGVLDGSSSTPVVNFASGTATTVVGGSPVLFSNLQVYGQIGVIDECAFYNTALSAARIAVHASAALTGRAGDSPGTRFGWVLDTINWPSDQRVISTGASVLQSAKLGQFAQTHLQGVADAEFGKFYVNQWGGIVLHSRQDAVDQVSQGTFVDSHNGSVNFINSATPEYTDQLIRNDVIIQRDGGVPEEATDATSISNYQINSYSKSGMYHNSDDLSLAAAQYLVANYKDPLQRISQLVLMPREDAVNLFPQALARDLTDWITVTYTAQGLGSPFTQTTVIEGIQHDFGPKSWKTTFFLSPADAKTYWKLGVTGFGELGVNTRLFYNLGPLGLLAGSPLAGTLSHALSAHSVPPFGNIGVLAVIGMALGTMGFRHLRRRNKASAVLDAPALPTGSPAVLKDRVVRVAQRAMSLVGIHAGDGVASAHVLGVRDGL